MKEKFKQSESYVVSDRSCAPEICGDNEWFIVRTSICHQGKIKGGEKMPEPTVTPSFYVIGTDRDAIKNEMCRLIDDVFNVKERSEESN